MSYSNLHYLPDAAAGHGVLYNFVRATNFDPNVMASGDLGETFTGTGKVLTEGGKGDRPLVVSYTTSPPADVIFATDGRTTPASVNQVGVYTWRVTALGNAPCANAISPNATIIQV